MEYLGIYAFYAWIIGMILNGMIAHEKKRSVPLCVIMSIICSPVMVYLYLLAVPSKEEK